MIRLTAILCALVGTVPSGASAQFPDVVCEEREILIDRLRQTHGAERQGKGMRDPDTTIEVWAVPSTGAWTLVQSYANGLACIIAIGESWEDQRERAAGPV